MADKKKSYMAFRTISEASEILQVPSHVLRFWEKQFESVSPLKRGGGRRYYRPRDISLLHGIKHFLYNKRYTIKRTQEVLRNKEKKVLIEIGQQKYNDKSKSIYNFSHENLQDLRIKILKKKRKILEIVKSDALTIDYQLGKKLQVLVSSLRNIQAKAMTRYD